MTKRENNFYLVSAHLLLLLFCCNTLQSVVSKIIRKPKPLSCIFSVPKCGTHLAARCVELLTNRTQANHWATDTSILEKFPSLSHDSFLVSHSYYNPLINQALYEHNAKAIFMSRDPRDQIVSMAFWIARDQHRFTNKFKSDPHSPTYISDLITEFIPQTAPLYNNFLLWMKSPRVLYVTFEELIGHLGGGNKLTQRQTIRRIAHHLEIPVTRELVENCMKNIFGNTPTFHAGAIGGWKKQFNAEQKQLSKKHLGRLLIQLGYEKDLNW